jgi:hypothetical protein
MLSLRQEPVSIHLDQRHSLPGRLLQVHRRPQPSGQPGAGPPADEAVSRNQPAEPAGTPMDVLWFQLPKLPGDAGAAVRGRRAARLAVALHRPEAPLRSTHLRMWAGPHPVPAE